LSFFSADVLWIRNEIFSFAKPTRTKTTEQKQSEFLKVKIVAAGIELTLYFTVHYIVEY